MEALIGREKEISILDKSMKSDRCELVAIYGRRRVGKTFLVRSYFKDKFDFYSTGVIKGTYQDEIHSFVNSLVEYGYLGPEPQNWNECFSCLGSLLELKSKNKKSKLVVFIDELPCYDTRNSGFVKAFDYFWNSKGSWFNNIKFFICGSATSWMIRNVINSHGGLHNRVTRELHVRPFNLYQTEQYFKINKFHYSQLSILQMYMSIGGIPYYLSLLDSEKDVYENIDSLFFGDDAALKQEFPRLFNSLYNSPEIYKDVIQVLSKSKRGMTRKEISSKLKVPDNGHLGDVLDNLEYCDFIRQYLNGGRQNGGIYQITDFYLLFYFQFCTKKHTDSHFWRNMMGTPVINNWYGLSFERVCLYHIQEIVHALRYDTIHTECYSWRSKKSSPGAQIDIIVDRADNNISICEVKYSNADYSLNKNEYEKIINRVETFRNETQTKKGLQVAIITTFGLKENPYSVISQRTILLKDLFLKINV